jgi:hypothetical protein
MNEAFTTLSPGDLGVACGICYENVTDSRKYRLGCRQCKNFTMCIACFDRYSAGEGPRRIVTKCPHCQDRNGFAYERRLRQEVMEEAPRFFETLTRLHSYMYDEGTHHRAFTVLFAPPPPSTASDDEPPPLAPSGVVMDG